MNRLRAPWRKIVNWVVTLAVAIGFVLAFEVEVAKPYRIPTSSMEGTLLCARPGPGCTGSTSDRVLVNRLAYDFGSPQRGQIVDGSAALLVASEAKASELELEPRARFVSFGVVGVDPHLMLHGNPEASAKALAKAGLTWDEIDVIEVNEAFASVVSQFLADTGLQERYEAGDVNPNGGGISLGHPLGATGARITATLVSELERRDARYGLATMCIGFGQAIAAVIERV